MVEVVPAKKGECDLVKNVQSTSSIVLSLEMNVTKSRKVGDDVDMKETRWY
jgi:hypothetical protein